MITQFINYQKQVRGLSPRTCDEYEKHLRQFATWARPQGLRWSTIKKQDVDRYTTERRETGLKPATVCLTVSVLRSIYRWMQHEGIMKTNPLQYSQSPKRAQTLPQPIDIVTIDKYLSSTPVDNADKMIHIFTALCTDTGMRIQEALDLDKTDIDFKNRSIRVHGKGNKERIVYYSKRFLEQMLKYCPLWQHGKLFAGFDQWTVRQMMSNYLGRWTTHPHPHQLRHTFATELLNNNMPIESVSRLLGHSSVQVTERYARLTNNKLQQEFTKYHS